MRCRARPCARSPRRSSPSNARGAVISLRACSAGGIVKGSTAGRIEIEIAPPPRCAGCNGACFWYQVPPSTKLAVAAAPLPVGAAVTITLPERYLVLGALLVYGVPLAALLCGGVLGSALLRSDLGAAAGAALALGAALLAAPALRGRLEKATLRELTVRPAGELESW